jgi:excisionase family DNA binding protein
MASERVPLYVRIPREQAAALDRLVDTTGQRKQKLVSDLLADRLELGRIELPEGGSSAPDVLTLEEVANLLRVPAPTVARLAQRGELPGRLLDGEWRFARSAVLRWLSGEQAGSGR